AWCLCRPSVRRADRLIHGFAALDRPLQITDRTGALLDANPAAERLFGAGVPIVETLARSARDEAMRERVARLVEKAGRGVNGREEVVLTDERDDSLWLQVESHALDGRDQVLWIAQDVTDRRQMEQTIAEERSRLLDLFEHAPVGVYSVGAD